MLETNVVKTSEKAKNDIIRTYHYGGANAKNRPKTDKTLKPTHDDSCKLSFTPSFTPSYVVIKRIKDNYVGRINERKEADILKNIKHSNLPQVYDFIQMDTEVYTVMDYIDGNTMMEYIKAGVRFDEPQTIKWLKDLCTALHYLHSQNPPIIHSDIKPSNIMIGSDGNICLIDFNISLNDPDNPMTTGYSKNYAAPEQLSGISSKKVQGAVADVRTDIFSLGASFYQLMSRKNAFG